MKEEDKVKLVAAHGVDDDGAIIWNGKLSLNCVYFQDMRSLIMEEEVWSNVIDLYAELLTMEQELLANGREFAEKLYFLGSLCLVHNSLPLFNLYCELFTVFMC